MEAIIKPVVVKAEAKPTVYTLHEDTIVNRKKPWPESNVVKMGNGPTAWRVTTNVSHEEIFGENVQAEIAELKESEVKPNFQ